MKIISWKIDSQLEQELENHYQSRRSFEAAKKSPQDVISEYTFSYGAPNLKLKDIDSFLSFIELVIGRKIVGEGLEVGAGPGTHSAILANRPLVTRVYAVEASRLIVENLMPIVVPYVLKEKEGKVVGVIGDFSNLELPDESLDFVFDFFSLHHSPNLKRTLTEIHRVLRPGGVLICLDKARDDSLTEADLNKLLDVEYGANFKKEMGIPESQSHTRRMNGENEYRRSDWFRFFDEAGFCEKSHFNIARTNSRLPIVAFLKSLLGKMPPKFQLIVTNFLPKKITSSISADSRLYYDIVNKYQKEISLLVAIK